MIKERDILALLLTKGLGPKGVSRILSTVSAQEDQIDLSLMSVAEMMQLMGIKPETANQIPESIKKADELLKELESQGIKVLIRGHVGYPKRLLKTLEEDAPLVLFAKGDVKILSQKAVGFCGSRKASEKGIAVTTECAAALANQHINVISGYAHGVDLAAHRAALEAGGVTTFVLAEGILHFKIKSDVKDLLTEDNHVVISEYMPRLPWLARNAMQRNKTICGLSNAVVVIESGLKGGTFEAGKAALELKRPLFVTEYAQPATTAEGNNYFLQKGARFLRKKNGAAYLDELFAAVEKDESNGTAPDTNPPASLYKETEADVLQTLSVWEPEKSYGEQAKAQTRDKGNVAYPKRLIEVDLPIKKISEHSRREKSIRHGHISTLHIWWARRPLAACRAVICAALWPDPGDPNCPERFRTEAARLMKAFRDKRGGTPYDWNDGVELRKALLEFIADFANWDNSTAKDFLEISRALTQVAHEALGGAPGTRPLVVDPFAGGGAIPLEAMRIGADAFASDLNPIPVLLNKVALEYIPLYGQRLASEVRKWGEWIKHEAEKELINFYPNDADGATPIAYIWARTIQCEGPRCGIELPLIGLPWLCKKGKRKVAIKVIPNLKDKRIDFELFSPKSEADLPPPISKRFSATCPICGFTTAYANVREQIRKRNGGARDGRLMAVILRKTDGSRHYRLPNEKDFKAIEAAKRSLAKLLSHDDQGSVSEPFPTWYSGVFNPGVWNISTWGGLYTPRQLFAMLSLSGILRRCIVEMTKSQKDKDFCKAVATCLSFPISNLSHYMSSVSIWAQDGMLSAFIQGSGIAMRPDFAEANPIVPGLVGGIDFSIEKTLGGLDELSKLSSPLSSHSQQASATDQPLPNDSVNCLVTDPPYYAAIPYSDLSDFCYVWLKRMIRELHPTLFNSELSPKDEEAIAYYTQPDGFNRINKDGAYFETIMEKALLDCRRTVAPNGVAVVIFAHKGTAGWEALLSALLKAGWIVTASWPIDTERAARMRANASATLASSIHLFCRPRENPDGSLRNDEIGDWRDVLAELPKRIHEWMPRLAEEGVVGADAIFACLGPALEIFSKYSRVEKASGEVVTLKEYLEHVWAAVAKEALNMIFEGAETTGFEEDARLTAMWLWTLSTGAQNGNGDFSAEDETEGEEEDEDKPSSKAKLSGYILEYDAARKIAQGLGAHLEKLQSLVEVKGDKARLLPVAERTKALFGKTEADTPRAKKKKKEQLSMFAEIEEAEESGSWGTKNVPQLGNTTLDRLHQAMILFAAGKSEALKRFLVEEGVGRDERFWCLAQALSALYPKNTDERRWVEGVLARKKGLGF